MTTRRMRPLASEPPVDSPYLTAKEAAAYLRFAHVSALYHAIETAGVPVCRRGRSLLFHRAQLDRWLAGESKVRLLSEARSRRHVETVTPNSSVSHLKPLESERSRA